LAEQGFALSDQHRIPGRRVASIASPAALRKPSSPRDESGSISKGIATA
jgi:hypothetical protein